MVAGNIFVHHDNFVLLVTRILLSRIVGQATKLTSSHLISSQSLDDVATIPFHSSLSSVALKESPNPIPVHPLMLSSHLFFCLPLLFAAFTVPCRIVFAMPEDLDIRPYHFIFRFFTMVRRLSCTPIAF